MTIETKFESFKTNQVFLKGGNFFSALYLSLIVSVIFTLSQFIDEPMSHTVIGFFLIAFVLLSFFGTIINIVASGRTGIGFMKTVALGWFLLLFSTIFIPSEEVYTIGEVLYEMITFLLVVVPIHLVFAFYRTKGLHDED